MEFSNDAPAADQVYDADMSFLNDIPATTAGLEQTIGLSDVTLDPLLSANTLDNFDVNDLDIAAQWQNTHPVDGIAEPEDYTRFENYIPQFERPDKPCDYCRSKHLECYKRKGQTDCTACKSLFRECSLDSTTMEASNYAYNTRGTFFDALHSVREDATIEQGSRATIKFLNSKTKQKDISFQPPGDKDDAPGSRGRNGIRFPRHAVKILREWLDDNQDHPYPTEEEKAALEESTGLKPNQIANWLANARRRRKVMTQSLRPKASASPSRPCSNPIDITQIDKPWDELNPLERWANSPPEHEPAAIDDIAEAVAHADLPQDGASTPSENGHRRHKTSSTGSGISGMRAPSATSAETSQASSLTNSSAAVSHGSSRGSFGSFSSSLAGKKDRRRRKRAAPARQDPNEKKKRPFQCTFCTDTFKSKYDWTRHEKSLHLSLEKYICAPLGPTIIDKETGEKMCVYCGLHNPPDGHDETHNHRACEEKGHDSRTFYRKDHLRQHLRLMHDCQLIPSMDAWKFTTTNINSRCGFCAQRFSLWQDRVDHITGHFRAGTRMIDWRGCRGLDPAVAAQVTNAMPPYLIGIESLSPNPFSATLESTHQGLTLDEDTANFAQRTSADPAQSDIPEKATCWEVLTIKLGKYANECVKQGIVLTDEMLQKRARLDLYGCDDTWNQTAADNPEWLDLFKKAHGLDLIPSAIGGQGGKVPEDLEWYSDLGMRIPFHVQLAHFNNERSGQGMADLSTPEPGRARKDREASIGMRDMYNKLVADRVLHDYAVDCPHPSCKDNKVEFGVVNNAGTISMMEQGWCTISLTPTTTTLLANFISLAQSKVPLARLTDEEEAKQDHAAKIQAAKARAACLEHLQHGEVNCCPFHEQNIVLGERREAYEARIAKDAGLRALSKREAGIVDGATELPSNRSVYLARDTDATRALQAKNDALYAKAKTDCALPSTTANAHDALRALSRTEAPLTDDCCPAEREFGYFPRHKASLPPEVARRYATITGAWQDSGMMPAAYSTASLQPSTTTATTTGAMMEFLGATAGDHLPFSNDAATSSLSMPMLTPGEQQQLAGQLGMTTSEEDLSNEFDSSRVSPVDEMPIVTTDLMAPTLDAIYDIPWTTADAMPSAVTTAHLESDAVLADLQMEDLNFESVFDMDMDDGPL